MRLLKNGVPILENLSGVLKVWIQAARPKTLWAGICPVVIGSVMAFANGKFHVLSALAALVGALLIQIGTNFANDYFDFKKGADTARRVGPKRATQSGAISPNAMKAAFVVTFALAVLAGIYLVVRGGWPIVLIGVAAVISGILYTGGPYPLGYLGLGDVFVLIFFGPVAVAGTYYVQALSMRPEVMIAGLAPGLLSVAILTVNNIRDIDEDKTTGKKTLAVRFGKHAARRHYIASVFLASIVPGVMLLIPPFKTTLLMTLLMLPLARPTVKLVMNQEGAALNVALEKTGRLLVIYTVLFCLAWII